MGGGDAASGAWLAAILIVTALVYSRCLDNGFVMDDSYTIVHDAYIGSWAAFWRLAFHGQGWFWDHSATKPGDCNYYRPLPNAWWALNFHLFGLHPTGYHATQVALHLVGVVIAFRIALALSMDRLIALLSAAFFALMPTQAEAVAGIYALNPLLSGVFQLGAFEVYLRHKSGPVPKWRMAAISLLLFGGALLSYESAVVFPALIAAHAFIFEEGRSGWGGHNFAARLRAMLIAALPYALEVGGYLLVRALVLGMAVPHMNHRAPLWWAALVLAIYSPELVAADAMVYAMPWRMGPRHSMHFAPRISEPGYYLPALALIALCAAAFLLLRRNPRREFYLFSGAWILVSLSAVLIPALAFVPRTIPAADAKLFPYLDRYLYLQSFGYCLLAAGIAADFARGGKMRAKAVSIGMAAILLGYAALTFHEQHFWHSDATVRQRSWEQSSQNDPGIDSAMHNDPDAHTMASAIALRGAALSHRAPIQALNLAGRPLSSTATASGPREPTA
ncbi:MAG: hypothetical protein ACREQI_15560 [Candidatus Binataceae bacterium]